MRRSSLFPKIFKYSAIRTLPASIILAVFPLIGVIFFNGGKDKELPLAAAILFFSLFSLIAIYTAVIFALTLRRSFPRKDGRGSELISSLLFSYLIITGILYLIFIISAMIMGSKAVNSAIMAEAALPLYLPAAFLFILLSMLLFSAFSFAIIASSVLSTVEKKKKGIISRTCVSLIIHFALYLLILILSLFIMSFTDIRGLSGLSPEDSYFTDNLAWLILSCDLSQCVFCILLFFRLLKLIPRHT